MPSNNELDLDAIHKRADQRARKRYEFILHLSIYVITNLSLWALFLILNHFLTWDLLLLIPLLTTLGWGLGLGIHGLVTYMETGMLDRMREQEVDREMQREMMRRGMISGEAAEKPKRGERDKVARLSEDGEMVFDEPQAKKRQSSKQD